MLVMVGEHFQHSHTDLTEKNRIQVDRNDMEEYQIIRHV